MTNITLSVRDDIYKRMKNYSEIKWSEYVRKIIEKRLEDLDKIELDRITRLSRGNFEKNCDNELDEMRKD